MKETKVRFLKIHDVISYHKYDDVSNTTSYWMRKEPIEVSFNASEIWLVQKIKRTVVLREEPSKKYQKAGFLKRFFMTACEKTTKVTKELEMTFIRMKDGSEYFASESYDRILKTLNG